MPLLLPPRTNTPHPGVARPWYDQYVDLAAIALIEAARDPAVGAGEYADRAIGCRLHSDLTDPLMELAVMTAGSLMASVTTLSGGSCTAAFHHDPEFKIIAITLQATAQVPCFATIYPGHAVAIITRRPRLRIVA